MSAKKVKGRGLVQSKEKGKKCCCAVCDFVFYCLCCWWVMVDGDVGLCRKEKGRSQASFFFCCCCFGGV